MLCSPGRLATLGTSRSLPVGRRRCSHPLAGIPLRTGGLRIQRLRIVGQHLGERAVLLRGQEWLWVKKRVPVGRVG